MGREIKYNYLLSVLVYSLNLEGGFSNGTKDMPSEQFLCFKMIFTRPMNGNKCLYYTDSSHFSALVDEWARLGGDASVTNLGWYKDRQFRKESNTGRYIGSRRSYPVHHSDPDSEQKWAGPQDIAGRRPISSPKKQNTA